MRDYDYDSDLFAKVDEAIGGFDNDDLRNPFTPAFGSMPKRFKGRFDVLTSFAKTLRSGAGSDGTARSITGARGSGKTVMLDFLYKYAIEHGYDAYSIDAYDGMIDTLIFKLLNTKKTSITTTIAPTISAPGFSIGLGSVSFQKTAGLDLSTVLEECCQFSKKGIVLFIDEVDIAYKQPLIELTKAYKQTLKYGKIFIVLAGLPEQVDALAKQPGTSFLFRTTPIVMSPITQDTSKDVLIDTCALSSITIDDDVAEYLAHATSGYPYAIQSFGSLAWDNACNAGHDQITMEDAKRASLRGQNIFITQVVKPTINELTNCELDFVLALSENDSLETDRQYILHALNWNKNKYSVYRDRLIMKQIVRIGTRGNLVFFIPFMKEYLRNNRDEIEAAREQGLNARYPLRGAIF